jgi:hypothetical protein
MVPAALTCRVCVCRVHAISNNLNFSSNLLVGAVPHLLTASVFFPAAFAWNCFDPAVSPSNPPEVCSPPSSSASATGSPSPSPRRAHDDALSTTAVAAIVATVAVTVTAVVAVAATVQVVVIRRRRHRAYAHATGSDAERELDSHTSESLATSLLAEAPVGTVAHAGMELRVTPAVGTSNSRGWQ